MKNYRLKKWYPSLLKNVRVGDIITENGQHYKGVTHKGISYRVEIWQLHPDFWELIEEEKPKPLFITEDGVEVHCRDWELFGVEVSTFKRAVVTSKSLNRHSFLLFANKHKADEYIWRNKRVFSYEDIIEHAHNKPKYRIFIEKLAKERSKQ